MTPSRHEASGRERASGHDCFLRGCTRRRPDKGNARHWDYAHGHERLCWLHWMEWRDSQAFRDGCADFLERPEAIDGWAETKGGWR